MGERMVPLGQSDGLIGQARPGACQERRMERAGLLVARAERRELPISQRCDRPDPIEDRHRPASDLLGLDPAHGRSDRVVEQRGDLLEVVEPLGARIGTSRPSACWRTQ